MLIQIGFIGLGHMGFPMARHLLQARHHVIAFDTHGAALERIVAQGARPAAERDEGPDADFTTVIKPLEKVAGVTVGPAPR
ncbi:NAD(P)-binding domain-containing protein [Mycobacterium sp. HUMS_1102779]|uniref:NAD(P)-binding domain-containing protein n=1 Tax=Mycobacterium sp. HUMS_1102779 TaxID=3383487 RepID=UPI003899A0EE